MWKFIPNATVRALAGSILLGVVAAESVVAQPTVQRLQPTGVTPGTTAQVQVIGGNLTPSSRLWTSCQLTAQPAPEQPAGNFLVTTPADTPLGIYGVRVVTEAGVSPLALFVVDDLPTVTAAADNRELTTAQAVTLPVAVDGAIEKLQRHFFRFDVAAGQRVSFDVLSRRLGSPLDPSLFLYTAEGREIAYSDDVEGLSGDCQLVYTFEQAGTYIVELRDIRYEGSGGHFYRLRIGDFPCLNIPFPLAVQRGRQTRVDFAGQSVEDADPAQVQVPADWPHDWYPVSTRRDGGTTHGFTTVAVTDEVEFREQEPNDTSGQANRIALGDNINGRFDRPGDEDRYTFAAKTGQRFVFSGITRQRGSATDLVLRLVDGTGKQLARKDDDATAEGAVDYTFPADGEYTLIAEDLHRRGGEPYAYRVEVEAFANGFSITPAADHIDAPVGGIGSVSVAIARKGIAGPISIDAAGLPQGWSSQPTIIGPGMNAGILTIHGPDISPTPPQLSEIEIVGTSQTGDVVTKETADLSPTLTAQFHNMRPVPLNVRTAVAVAAGPKKPYSLRLEKPEIVLGQHLTTSVKVIADRGDTITEAITLATVPDKNALPADVTLALKTIEKGQTEVVLDLTAGEKAPQGTFSVVLTATHTIEKTTVVVTSPPLTFRIEPALQLQVDAGDRNLPRGGEQKVTVTVNRNPAFNGEVTIALDKLPAGVTADGITLPADQNTVELTLKATPEAAQGEHADVTINATAVGNDKLKATTNLGPLTVP